jgi:hypothetical protein
MTFRVRIDPIAQRRLDEFAAYCSAYNEEFAKEQFDRLNHILTFELGDSPLAWNYFPLTGAPYRAYLFRVGRRTQFWIVYTVDERMRVVDVLHFWNTGRDTTDFGR